MRVLLEQNYRSSSTIVRASSALVAHNASRVPKTVYSAAPDGAPITVAACRTGRDEGFFVVESVNRLLASGRAHRDIAILYRTARVGASLQEFLAASRVPFNTHATNFWEVRAWDW